MTEPNRRGRPPKPASERAVRTTIALSRKDFARLDAVPGKSRSDRIRFLLGYWQEGIELAGKQTHSVFQYFREGRRYHYVITVCSKEAEERCPIFPGIGRMKRLHWPFEDPSQASGTQEEKLVKVRVIRDQIRHRIQQFIAESSEQA